MNQNNEQFRNHNGGLYCGEGGVHVGRASTRVRAPPGGASSFSFSTSSTSYSAQPKNHGVSTTGPQHIQHQDRAPLRNINAQPVHPQHTNVATPVKSTDNFARGNHPSTLKGSPYRQDSQPHESNNAPLYCGEGGVHVSRRSTRVRAPPGGASSITF